jgi:tetratricopeptide (TPR) repeat protein
MLVIKRILLIIIIFSFPIEIKADSSNQIKLKLFFKDLKEVKSRYEAKSLEYKIWEIWHKHPSDDLLTDRLNFATQLMQQRNYQYALHIFTSIINKDPNWSESWNKRATLLYLIEDYDRSLKDIKHVLELEPRHFGALSGRAQIYIKLENYEKAIIDLNQVKKIHPTSISNEIILELKNLINGLNI